MSDLLADLPPSQLSIDALNTITPNVADLPPSQLSIDALNTTTPYLADLPQRTSTYEGPFTFMYVLACMAICLALVLYVVTSGC